ncbi:hypothetical protein HW115_19030 [Verrucomicrobiaceae bacterium N1E253]|uniref:Uncharacterized protein n=1 Tax=Oceaniferula marina TaxID=2748318 RepID=A0A851GSG4_9BACT|nr:hypothetical protein [Oceaniferula marina]NWK57720.1 hypothetical protein [Oceaniferula marina]
MNPPLIFGIICVIITIWHEISWLNRRCWKKLEAQIVDVVERTRKGKLSYYPVLAYTFRGSEERFTSKYGSNIKPDINSEAIALISPDGSKIEQYSLSNRWFLTILPLTMSIALILKGLDIF